MTYIDILATIAAVLAIIVSIIVILGMVNHWYNKRKPLPQPEKKLDDYMEKGWRGTGRTESGNAKQIDMGKAMESLWKTLEEKEAKRMEEVSKMKVDPHADEIWKELEGEEDKRIKEIQQTQKECMAELDRVRKLGGKATFHPEGTSKGILGIVGEETVFRQLHTRARIISVGKMNREPDGNLDMSGWVFDGRGRSITFFRADKPEMVAGYTMEELKQIYDNHKKEG